MARNIRVLSIAHKRGACMEDVLNVIRREDRPVDLILLPEACRGLVGPETEDSPFLKEVSEIAAQKHAWFLCPIYTPAEAGHVNNTALLFDRSGNLAGCYNKLFPVLSEKNREEYSVIAGNEPVVIDTDFGKLGIAICFDANFLEVFQGLQDLGADLVLFVSDYPGRLAIRSLACFHHYYIVSATRNCDCTIADITGEELYFNRVPIDEIGINYFALDMDRCIFHRNYNTEKRDKLLAENPEIYMDKDVETDHWFVLASKEESVSAKELAHQYGLELVNDYIERSRQGVNPGLRKRVYADREFVNNRHGNKEK